MPIAESSLALARNAMPCNACFNNGDLKRAGIGMPQPFTVGRGYKPGGIAVLSINPGASSDGGDKEARLHALTRFAAGNDSALTDYWAALAADASRFWNPRYLTRLNNLGLEIDSIAVGNIALCATDGNKYPAWVLKQCWRLHTEQMLTGLQPGSVVLMGSESVMSRYQLAAAALSGTSRTIRMAHFAHREGHAREYAECHRVRAFLAVGT